MSSNSGIHRYREGSRLLRRLDRWVTRETPQSNVGQETDWLGWDGWVRPGNASSPTGGQVRPTGKQAPFD